MPKPHCASCSPLRLATTVVGHMPAPPHLLSMDFCISRTQANRKRALTLRRKDICTEQQLTMGKLPSAKGLLPTETKASPQKAGGTVLVALCYFESLLSQHRKELSKRSRGKVTETPGKPVLEEDRNFSSVTVCNYKPRDKTRQKQRSSLEDGYQILK